MQPIAYTSDPKDFDFNEEVGVSGLEQYSGYVNEEWLTALQGQQGVRLYREMSDNSAIVGALLYLIESLVQQTPTRFDPAAGPDVDKKRAAECADFMDSVLLDMSQTFPDTLCEILTMLPYGWAYFERVYKVRGGDTDDPTTRSRYNDGLIGIRKLAIRSQSTLVNWKLDDDGGIRGMYQSAPPTYRQTFLPIEKCVLFRTKTNKNSPEGRSVLRNAYFDYYHAKRLTELESIGVERDCTGMPGMEVPPALLASDASSADKLKATNLLKQLQQMRRGTREAWLIPSEETKDGKKTGYKLRLLSGGGSRQFDIGEIIKRHEQRIAMVALGEFLLIGLDKVGSFSLVSSKTDLFATALGTMLTRIAATLNRFVFGPLLKINGFDQNVWPTFAFGDIEAPDLSQIVGYIKGLSDIDALTLDDNLKTKLREMANLPPAPEQERPDVEARAGVVGEGAPTENVQQAALNGAQVSSLVGIVQGVAAGMLPRDSGIALILAAFPLSPQQAESIMGSVGQGFVATSPDATSGPAAGPALASSPVRSEPPPPVLALSTGGAHLG